jgi:putative ABC transport system permease protein
LNISDIHLKGRSTYEMKPLGSITYVAIACGLIVIIFLQITCNFINFNLVSVGKSAKQIAIKKAIGASRGHLFSMFIGESIVLTGAAMLLALAGVELTYGYFNQLVETHITFTLNANIALLAVAFSVFIGIINGAYAGLMLANVDVRLLARTHYRYNLSLLVKSILCFQAGLAIFIFVVFVVAQLQMRHILNKDIGYKLDNRLVVKQIPTAFLFDKAHPHLINALSKLPGVVSVTATDINLTEQIRGGVTLTWPNGQIVPGVSPSVTSHFNVVETLGLTLLAGRDFNPQYRDDWYKTLPDGTKSMAVIVTESMVRAAGYESEQQVIGMTLSNDEEQLNATVVGVVADIKVGSVQNETTPLSFNLARHFMSHGNVVIKAHADTTLSELKTQITTLLQSRFSLLDSEVTSMADDYAKNYKNELKIITISKWLLVISSLLTLLSLAVLVSQTVINQHKNLAIRKVLGAPITQLVTELSYSYFKLILLSLLFSIPLAYWSIDTWLHSFNDRIIQPIWVYLLAATVVAVITWLTVATLAFKAASTRPSEVLRHE